uniref:hypothetical protein n=1 Tax=Streptococcus anginosus TaxID=1328 RepID=UPI002EDBA989
FKSAIASLVEDIQNYIQNEIQVKCKCKDLKKRRKGNPSSRKKRNYIRALEHRSKLEEIKSKTLKNNNKQVGKFISVKEDVQVNEISSKI